MERPLHVTAPSNAVATANTTPQSPGTADSYATPPPHPPADAPPPSMGNAATVAGLGATAINNTAKQASSSRATSPCPPPPSSSSVPPLSTTTMTPVAASGSRRQSPPTTSTTTTSGKLSRPTEEQRPHSASHVTSSPSIEYQQHHQKTASLTRNQSPSHMRRSRERDRVRQQQEIMDGSAGEFQFMIGGGGADLGGYTDESQLLEDTGGGTSRTGPSSATLIVNEDLDGGLFYPSQFSQQQQMRDNQQQQQSTPSGSAGERTLGSRVNSSQALDRLNTKIACTKESIRKEQTSRDDNVNEYLKLAANADKQQLGRIKAVFEKKNQKSAHTISQLQKKLESYSKRATDLRQTTGLPSSATSSQQYKQPREMLRDVGQGLKNVGGNIRDGITGLGGSVMSKPREFAHLIKNKFGSADNINQLSAKWYTDPDLNTLNLSGMDGSAAAAASTPNQHHHHHPHHHHHRQGPGSGSGNGAGGGGGKFNSENGSECSSVTSDSLPAGSGKNQSSSGVGGGGAAGVVSGGQPATSGAASGPNNGTSGGGGGGSTALVLKTIIAELQERREDCDRLRTKVDRFETMQKEVADLTLALDSERYRAERLEEQINDLTELHQNEIENLKQTMADMEEKVQYQSDERLRDVHEVLENCQTRITKMEHLSQQQYLTVEGIDNSNARALLVKLINVVLTVLQVVLLLVATAAGIVMPFLKTRVRVLTTLLFILVTIVVIRQWPQLMQHLDESWISRQ